MADTLREQVMAFLSDRSRMELRFTHDRRNHLLIRSPFDEETDFFYILRSHGDADPHDLGGAAEFAGIYSHLTHQAYTVCYELNKLIDAPEENGKHFISKQISQMASDMVVLKIHGQPVEVTEESKEPPYDREYFLNYQLEERAYEHFMMRTVPEMTPVVPVEGITAEEFVMAINHPRQLAEIYAMSYIRKRAKALNQFLWEKPQVIARIVELEATPGEHHYRRAIRESIHDEKMVRMQVAKDKKYIDCRIEAGVLNNVDRGYYPLWRMDASSRKEFEEAYGSGARLYPQDIMNISYGKKFLYMKANVHVPEGNEPKI